MADKDFYAIEPYQGNEPYIFVSYAHKNGTAVKEIIYHLNQAGYRIWYDAGIDPGTEWAEYIASRVANCTYFVAFITEEYLQSSNCKDELNYARDKDRKRLLVYLSNVTMSEGMSMRLNRVQAIHKYTYKNEVDFYDKFDAATGISACRRQENAPAEATAPAASAPVQKVSAPAKAPAAPAAKKSFFKSKAFVAIVAVAALLIIGGTLAALNSPRNVTGKAYSTDAIFKDGAYPVMNGEYTGLWYHGKPNGKGVLTLNGGYVLSGTFVDGYLDGQGTMTSPNIGSYEGEWKNGKKNGKGKYTYANEEVYEGEWKDDKRNDPSHGKMQYENGDYYDGAWENDKRNGQGKLTYNNSNKAVYEGGWKDDLCDGKGIITDTNGTYDGNWVNGYKEGKGTFTSADGSVVYDGNYKNNKYDGQGKLTDANGTYDGAWVNGKKEGKGKYTSADGSVVYDGDYKNDKYDGQGKYTWLYGAVYEGEWKDGKMHGQGKYTYPDGVVLTGKWENNKNVSGNKTNPAGCVEKKYANCEYKGQMKNNKFNGRGKLTWNDTAVYEGEFKDNKYDGQGRLKYNSGNIYEGFFKDGERHGFGRYTKPDGTVISAGKWENNEFVG